MNLYQRSSEQLEFIKRLSENPASTISELPPVEPGLIPIGPIEIFFDAKEYRARSIKALKHDPGYWTQAEWDAKVVYHFLWAFDMQEEAEEWQALLRVNP